MGAALNPVKLLVHAACTCAPGRPGTKSSLRMCTGRSELARGMTESLPPSKALRQAMPTDCQPHRNRDTSLTCHHLSLRPQTSTASAAGLPAPPHPETVAAPRRGSTAAGSDWCQSLCPCPRRQLWGTCQQTSTPHRRVSMGAAQATSDGKRR
jgi:hypothetical protein